MPALRLTFIFLTPMAQFDINILGCGSATPTPLHNPSCQVIDYRDNLFMIDCGEGAQSMMRRMKLRFSRLNHIFISHLPGLLSTLALNERSGRVVIHIPAEGMKQMKQFTDFFCREAPYDIVYEPVTGRGGMVFDSPSLTVETFPLYHRVPCFGYIFREKPKPRHLRGDMVRFHNIPVSAIRSIKEGADFTTPDGRIIPNAALTSDPDPSMSYAYCSDTMFDPRVAEAVRGVDTLYHEATYHSDLAPQARERGHSTAAQAAQIAAMAGVKRLIIGHYSKRYTDVDILLADARQYFPEVIAAREGLTISLL